jgi:hypothetical protein
LRKSFRECEAPAEPRSSLDSALKMRFHAESRRKRWLFR